MKKILNGKLYDTDTATFIDEYSNDYGTRDFRSMQESLYRKKNGEFFLCGEGGPMTRYAEKCGDMWGSGKGIIPISEAEAREWLEKYSDTETYIETFGEPED